MKLTLLLMLYPFLMLAQTQEHNTMFGWKAQNGFGWWPMDSIKAKMGVSDVGGNMKGGSINQVLKKVSGTNYDWVWADLAGGGNMVSTNNLSDVADVPTARSNLGLVIGTNVLAPNGSAASSS